MKALSLLATTISVLSFPMIFLALLYPSIASPRWGRWGGFFLYLGISLAALLVAVFSTTGLNLGEENWQMTDWLVLLIGGGGILAFLTRTWWWPAASETEDPSHQLPGSSIRKGKDSKAKRKR